MKDYDLIKLLKKDADLGLGELIKSYSGLVCSVIKGTGASLFSAEDTEDLASDVFYDFYRNIKKFKPELGSIKSFLCVMAKRKALDLLRKRAKESGNISMDDEETFLQFADELAADEEFFAEEERAALLREIAALGEPDSEIITRKFFFRETTKSIAERLGLTAANVDVRTHRAILKLREKIGGNNK
ncbi:MAG: sigma-70 family RNA polymerase sigma factor [Clostridia bacterium]|nr:sigma-70 family RNA polymerase sigma factor [Clostridia bacterium]